MEILNITEFKRKKSYLRSNAGPEVKVFWEKNYGLKTTIDTMKTRECSKANAVATRGLAEGIDLVKGWKVKNYDTEAVKDLLKQN